MIELEKRKAIFLLHQEGMPSREISRRLGLGRNTVRRIIAQEGRVPARSFTPAIDPELLRRLHQECHGYVQRVWEKLQEEHGLKIKYSTLTRWLRLLGIRACTKSEGWTVFDRPSGVKWRACALLLSILPT